MAKKWYDKQEFSAKVNGVDYVFYAHTTDTRCGFCHTIQISRDYTFYGTDTKVSYYNRTWESFTYETALRRAIEKCPNADQQALIDILIHKKAQEEHEKCEAFLKKFEGEYNKLSPKNKEILKNSPTIQSEEQARGVLGVMTMMNILG